MGFARIGTWALSGIEAPPVSVEVHLSNGLPAFHVVGLPEGAVRESRERVRSALLNSGFELPAKRITVNLAPADLPKQGGRYDLPIALGVLVASGQLPAEPVTQVNWLGELGLSGDVRAVEGVLPAGMAALQAQAWIGVPEANLEELGVLPGLQAMGVGHLSEIAAWGVGKGELKRLVPVHQCPQPVFNLDWSDVRGQLQAKRALEVAVAGGHAVLLVGPPGCGKSMLAERVPTLMPPLEVAAAQDVAVIHSVAGWPRRSEAFFQPPYCKGESTVSAAGLVGGGQPVRPGLISLAHHGVLFLDELTEFRRDALEALRAPMESGEVHITRARQHVVYPARPHVLIGAMNPTPSGYYPGDPRCKETPDQIQRYLAKLSGPLLDRMDIKVALQPVEAEALMDLPVGESSAVVRQRVERTWQRQLARQGAFNSRLEVSQLEQVAQLGAEEKALLKKLMGVLGLSARAYVRLLRVARTLADLNGDDRVGAAHIQEAASLQRLPGGLL